MEEEEGEVKAFFSPLFFLVPLSIFFFFSFHSFTEVGGVGWI